MNISIIIPSYNTENSIGKTLTKLEQQITACTYEVIVVDCSEHDRVKTLCNTFAHCQYFPVKERFNPGIGRNIGAQQAQGDLLIFVDADVQLANDVLDKAWEHFKQGAPVFGGALELNTAECADNAAYLEHYFFNHESQATRPACERNNLSSAFMCFTKSVFLDAGGFKDIPRMQDTELTERLKQEKNIALMFYPDMVALQTQDSPLKKVLRKIYINGQNLYYIRYQKQLSPLKKLITALLLPLMGAAKTLRIIGRHLKHQPTAGKLKTLLISPWLILGGIVWTLGFYNALITQKGMSSQR